MAKVFIIQEINNRDYSSAQAFGELCFINDEDINNRISLVDSPKNARLLSGVIDRLYEAYEPGDTLLFDGNPVMLSIAFAFIQYRLNYDVSILKWDNRSNEYQKITVRADLICALEQRRGGDK